MGAPAAQISAANTTSPVSPEGQNLATQSQSSINASQQGLAQQQALANAMLAQNGIGNQSAVFNQGQSLGNQNQILSNLLAANNGVGNEASAYGQTQQLANQLGNAGGVQAQQSALQGLTGVASGAGPNPALAQLQQATGQNVQNQAALMAGQRGAGANVGLLARQAGQQGAATQQQAVGQGATLQAQQQLSALGQMGQLGQGLTSQQQAQQAALAGQANAQVGQQQAQQSAQLQQQQAQANLANTQAGQEANVLGQYTSGLQNNQSQLLNALGSQNQQAVGMQSNINNANVQQQMANNQIAASAIGGLAGGVGGALTKLAKGGEVGNPKLNQVPSKDRFPSHAYLPSHLKEVATLYHPHTFGAETRAAHQGYSYGGNVGSSLKTGGKVPGQAKMSGDHEANDTVAAKLSPGEVVIPKSVMESDDPVSGAAQFVAALQKKKGSGGKDHQAEFKEALNRAIQGRKKK